MSPTEQAAPEPRRRARGHPLTAGTIALFGLTTGCIPYALGNTAQTVPEGAVVASNTVYYAVGSPKPQAGSVETSVIAMDGEVRFGLDGRSDIGVRVPGLNGAVVSYKRRVTPALPGVMGVALQAGGGVVSAGTDGLLEAALLLSFREQRKFTPYCGVKALYTFPLSTDADHDGAIAGGVLGFRIGRQHLGVSVEVGVFYDHATLGLKSPSQTVVPSVTLHVGKLGRR